MPSKEIRRMMGQLEQYESILRKLREPQSDFQKLFQESPSFKAIQKVYEANRAFHSLPDNLIQQLENNLRPKGPFYAIGSLGHRYGFEHMAKVVEDLNASIALSELIAGFETDRPGDEDAEDEVGLEYADCEQLLEIVPERVYRSLERVGFEPILTLDQAARNPEILRGLRGRQFEQVIAVLIDQLGFEEVVLTDESGDGGRDILATKNIHGLNLLFAFECKCYAKDRPIGPDIMRSLMGVISSRDTAATQGVLVTTSRFTDGSKKIILREPCLEGVDFDGIVEWIKSAKGSQEFH